MDIIGVFCFVVIVVFYYFYTDFVLKPKGPDFKKLYWLVVCIVALLIAIWTVGKIIES